MTVSVCGIFFLVKVSEISNIPPCISLLVFLLLNFTFASAGAPSIIMQGAVFPCSISYSFSNLMDILILSKVIF